MSHDTDHLHAVTEAVAGALEPHLGWARGLAAAADVTTALRQHRDAVGGWLWPGTPPDVQTGPGPVEVHVLGQEEPVETIPNPPQRIALASYDGATSTGTTHLVYLDRWVANTACGDAWELDRATPHQLPAPLTCDRCRARLDVPRRPIDAAQLRRLLVHRDPRATVVVTEPLEEPAHG